MAIRREDRAKQFAPFEALNGLRQALKQVEIEHEKIVKAELSDETKQEIEDELCKVQIGSRVKATFYNDGCYLNVTGVVTRLDVVYKYIMIGEGKISFDDLYGLSVL